MTDQEIIEGLIVRNNEITREFFYERCHPLFCKIISHVFSYAVDYDEFVNELYIYLMEDDARKLRNFGYRCSVYQWLKVLAIRFFIKKRDRMIEDSSKVHLYERLKIVKSEEKTEMTMFDLQRLFQLMPSQRYAFVIRRLVIEEYDPQNLAEEMGITTANIYNLKRRAMAQLTRVALNDIKNYGK